MKEKNIGHSIRIRLLNLSHKKNEPFQLLVVRYLQERFLFRLSLSPFNQNFLLKGGALLYAHQYLLSRPTRDIDFLGSHFSNDIPWIKKAIQGICEIHVPDDGVQFSPHAVRIEKITLDRAYSGVRCVIPVDLDTIRQQLSIDIGFGDVVLHPLTRIQYPVLFDNVPPVQIYSYPIESVIAEKFQTMIERASANSRMKDLFDVYVLLREGNWNKTKLRQAIRATFKNRETNYQDNHYLFSELFVTDAEMKNRWEAFLKKLKIDESFDFPKIAVFIQKELRPYWEQLRP